MRFDNAVAIGVCAVSCAAACAVNTASQPEQRASDASPGVRNGHALAWDEASASLVLFGGASERAVVGDTWTWRPERGWRFLETPGPSPRTFAAMAASPTRVILHGGNRVLFGSDAAPPAALGDTWEWRDNSWRLLDTPEGPGPRVEASFAYDAATERFVLFGGYRIADGAYEFMGDTWTFDGRRWTPLLDATDSKTGPLPQAGTAMTFDPIRRHVVLWTRSEDKQAGRAFALIGDRWNPVGDEIRPARYLASLAALPSTGAPVLIGGWTGTERSDEVFALQRGRWQVLPGPGPSARNHAAATAMPTTGQVLLYGGHDGERVFGDFWAYDGIAWRELGAVAPRRRVPNGH